MEVMCSWRSRVLNSKSLTLQLSWYCLYILSQTNSCFGVGVTLLELFEEKWKEGSIAGVNFLA